MKHKLYKKMLSIFILSSLITFNFNGAFAENIAITNDNNVINTSFVESKFVLTEEEYKRKTALELAELVKSKKVTSEELVKIAFAVIEKENPKLNAVISTRKEEALAEAKEFDKKTDAEKTKLPFAGVPTLMKGIGHLVKGQPNTLGYVYNKDVIANTDGSVTKEFKKLGFVILGTTNYPEGAMRNITDSKLYGTSNNPFNTKHNSGGSSGGSASAVASGMVPIASGSDIGGSIRIPASWTGLIGLKPSSKSYVVHFPLVKSVADAEQIFSNLDNIKKLKINFAEVENIKTLKVGYTTKVYEGIEVSKDVEKAVLESVEFLKKQGFNIEKIEYPLDAKYMLEQYTNVATTSIKDLDKQLKKNNLTKYDVDPLTWALHIYVKDLSEGHSKNIKNSRDNIEKAVEKIKEFHKKYPIILTPTATTVAPLNSDEYVTEEMKNILYNFEKVEKEKRYELLVKQWEPMFKRTPYTLISNLTKEPSITLPTYLSKNNLPLGILLNAPYGYDKVLLDFAKLFEDNGMFKMNKSIVEKTEELKQVEQSKGKYTTTITNKEGTIKVKQKENNIGNSSNGTFTSGITQQSKNKLPKTSVAKSPKENISIATMLRMIDL